MRNIFNLDLVTGDVRLALDDPRIDGEVESMTIEVAVRDHPGTPVYGRRAAQLIINMCNTAPVVNECFLGNTKENSLFIDGTQITITDSDIPIANKDVAIVMKGIHVGGTTIDNAGMLYHITYTPCFFCTIDLKI